MDQKKEPRMFVEHPGDLYTWMSDFPTLALFLQKKFAIFWPPKTQSVTLSEMMILGVSSGHLRFLRLRGVRLFRCLDLYNL